MLVFLQIDYLNIRHVNSVFEPGVIGGLDISIFEEDFL